MTVPFAFANLSGNIALAKLDSNFNTPITIGNTSVLLGNTVTTLNNLTLANVTISSGTASNISLTSPLAVSSGGTGSANLTVNNVLIGNGTSAVTSVAPGTTGNVLTSIGGAWVSNVALTSVAAGSNTQVQYNSANLLSGSANLTFDGTNLGLAGGTANGVAYLNGSKVLTTGSALTFDGSTLGVSASIASATLVSSGAYSALNFTNSGGATKAGLILTNSSGILQSRAETSAWTNYDASTEYMRLTSTGLGIGTSSPTQKLHVNGNIRVEGATSEIFMATGAERTISASGSSSSTALTFKRWNGASYVNDVIMDGSGNLGIGTSSPSNKLVVSNAGANGLEINPNSGVSSGASLNGYNRSTSAYTPVTYTALSHYFQVGSSPATAATLDSSGNLGLGVTPSAWASFIPRAIELPNGVGFASQSNAPVAHFTANAYYDGSWRYKANGVSARYALGSDTHQWFTAPSGTAGNAITFTQAMTLDASGLLTVGNTSPAGSSQITAYGASNGQIAVQNSTNWSRLLQNSSDLYIDNGVGGSAGNTIFRGSSSTVERMRLDSSGNLGIGATASASAILDAQSTTKGVRMPNMTTTQKNAISSPAAGLMVFDTTLAKLCVYSGSAWQTITSV